MDKFRGKNNHIPESDVDTFLSAAERRLETGGREGSHLTPVFNRLRSHKLSEIIGPQSTKDQCLLLQKYPHHRIFDNITLVKTNDEA